MGSGAVMAAVLVAVAFAAGAAGTWLARALAWTAGIVDPPNPMVPQHTRTTARLGGVGIAIGTAAAALVAGVTSAPLLSAPAARALACPVGLAAFLGLGIYDDVRRLRPAAKLAGQIVVAAAVVVVAGPSAPAAEAALSVVWLVTVVNAVNLSDVCDGLAGSIAIPALVAAAVVSPSIAPLALVLAAATAGFLRFNRAPATIFLGDGGSHLLGFAIGYLWFLAVQEQPSWNRAAAALLAVGVFGFELVFLVVVRSLHGIPFWLASPDHFSLRLQGAGLSRTGTVAVALAAATFLSGLAVWLARAPGVLVVELATAALLVTGFAGWLLYARDPLPVPGRPPDGDVPG